MVSRITGLDRNEPILFETDIDNIKATKLIMGHDIVACEEFYVHNNNVIYLERKKTVPEELLHPAYMYLLCNRISYSHAGFMLHHTTPHKMY